MITETGNKRQYIFDNEYKYVVQSGPDGGYVKITYFRYDSCIAIAERYDGEIRFEFRKNVFDPEGVEMQIKRAFLMADEEDFFIGKYKRMEGYYE